MLSLNILPRNVVEQELLLLVLLEYTMRLFVAHYVMLIRVYLLLKQRAIGVWACNLRLIVLLFFVLFFWLVIVIVTLERFIFDLFLDHVSLGLYLREPEAKLELR